MLTVLTVIRILVLAVPSPAGLLAWWLARSLRGSTADSLLLRGSDRAGGITGATVSIDGGYAAQYRSTGRKPSPPDRAATARR